MSQIPTKIIVNCETGEETILPLTIEEIADMEETARKYAEQKIFEEAKAQALAEAKASALAKLQELGLTEEEAIALIS